MVWSVLNGGDMNMRWRRFFLLSILIPALVPAFTQMKRIDPKMFIMANSGDAKSQYQLGQAYALGDGVVQDFAQAAACT